MTVAAARRRPTTDFYKGPVPPLNEVERMLAFSALDLDKRPADPITARLCHVLAKSLKVCCCYNRSAVVHDQHSVYLMPNGMSLGHLCKAQMHGLLGLLSCLHAMQFQASEHLPDATTIVGCCIHAVSSMCMLSGQTLLEHHVLLNADSHARNCGTVGGVCELALHQ